MEKILVINSKRPYPVFDGAAIRSMQMIKMLSQDYLVDLIYIYEKELNSPYLNELSSCCNMVYSVKLSKWKSYYNSFIGLFRKRPLQCSYFYSEKTQQIVDLKIDSYKFIFCNNIRTSQYVLDKKCFKIIDYVDAISMNYKKASKYANLFWKILYKIEAERCLQYERKILGIFDRKLVISNIDRDYILGDNDVTATIGIVNNSVNIPEKIVKQNSENKIVFVGTMDYAPNVIAVTKFCKYIFPLILQKNKLTKFYIVGSRPTKQVKKLANGNIIVTGFVDDPKKYLLDATLVVVPMFTGAGVQNKILEAMSLGCCVVTTTIGSEGLNNIQKNKELFICDSYNEFADCVVTLMNDYSLRETTGCSARRYIENNYTFDKILNDFRKALF